MSGSDGGLPEHKVGGVVNGHGEGAWTEGFGIIGHRGMLGNLPPVADFAGPGNCMSRRIGRRLRVAVQTLVAVPSLNFRTRDHRPVSNV